MKHTFLFVLTIFVCVLLSGCGQSIDEDETGEESIIPEENQKDDEGKEEEMNEEKLFDFKFINRAPKTTEDKPMDDVIKIFFHETSFDDPYEAVAIDLENKEVYAEPSLSIRGVKGDLIVDSGRTDDVYDILEKYHVSTWETEYIVGDPDDYEDGYSWRLMLQFKDGTVKTYKGNEEDEKPDNFDEFSRDLHGFSERELER